MTPYGCRRPEIVSEDGFEAPEVQVVSDLDATVAYKGIGQGRITRSSRLRAGLLLGRAHRLVLSPHSRNLEV
jgi:hypothetical protein